MKAYSKWDHQGSDGKETKVEKVSNIVKSQ